MAFSTLRKYNVQHGMQPQVAPSKGAAGAPGAASIPSGPAGGSPANDAAALAGMGAVGAGLLGKFAYDKYNTPDVPFEYQNPTAGPNAGSDGNFDISRAMNAADTPQGPALPGVAAAGAPDVSDGYKFNLFGSGRAGDAAMNIVSPLAKPLGIDDTMADLQDKYGIDPITGIWGKVF